MKKTLLSSLLALSLASTLNAAVIATVNGETINDTEADALVAAFQQGATYNNLPAEMKKRVLDDLVNRKLLLSDAKAVGIEKDPEFMTAMQNVREGIILDTYMKKIFNTIKVSDSDAKVYYDGNKDRFNQPASMRAKHILVQTEAEAKSIIDELKKLSGDAQVKKFQELAAAKSIDKGSAEQGGELGWFAQSQMVPEFGNAAAAMKKGEISSKPVKTNFGFHVILKEDFKAAGVVPFDQVKPQIVDMLKMEKFQTTIKAKGDALRQKAKIEYK